MPTSDQPPRLAQGDVVVVPFPHADKLAEKRRPAVVISGRALLEKKLVWLAMVTSAENAGWPCDIPIGDLSGTGLTAPSIIRPWKLATVDSARVIRVAGKLSPAVRSRLMEQIAEGLRD
jgi:mRNA interferase MazF